MKKVLFDRIEGHQSSDAAYMLGLTDDVKLSLAENNCLRWRVCGRDQLLLAESQSSH